MRKITNSHWGQVDQQRQIAPGLIRVHTPSHGGYWLSPERRAEVAALLPNVRPFTRTLEWLEEDADWIIAALVWPELFGGRAMYHIMKHTSPTGCYGYIMRNIPDDFFRSPHGSKFMKDAERWHAENHDSWEMSGYVGPGKNDRRMMLRQLSTGRTRVVAVAEYPDTDLFTNAQVAEMPDYVEPQQRAAAQLYAAMSAGM